MKRGREDRPAVTQKPGAPVMSSLTYSYLDRKGSLVGCFEVINPYLNVVSIMNYQTKGAGGESFDLFFFAPIMHDVFPQKTLKSISSCLLSCSGQRATLTGVNPFLPHPGSKRLWVDVGQGLRSKGNTERVKSLHHVTRSLAQGWCPLSEMVR